MYASWLPPRGAAVCMTTRIFPTRESNREIDEGVAGSMASIGATVVETIAAGAGIGTVCAREL